MSKIISWENPPEKGQSFALYLEGKRMIFLEDVSDVNEDKPGYYETEKIVGWMPYFVSLGTSVPLMAIVLLNLNFCGFIELEAAQTPSDHAIKYTSS